MSSNNISWAFTSTAYFCLCFFDDVYFFAPPHPLLQFQFNVFFNVHVFIFNVSSYFHIITHHNNSNSLQSSYFIVIISKNNIIICWELNVLLFKSDRVLLTNTQLSKMNEDIGKNIENLQTVKLMEQKTKLQKWWWGGINIRTAIATTQSTKYMYY